MSNYDRRQFLSGGLKAGVALGALGGGGVLLDACGGSNGGSNTTLSTLAHKQAVSVGVNNSKPKLGGTVTFGTEAEETGMDPTQAHYDSTGVLYARAVFDPLAMVLSDGTVAPYLAESIVPNKTYTKWAITVRKNVVFHDGTPCDGNALAFCMRQFLLSSLTNFAFTNYVNIKSPNTSVTVEGTHTIIIHMEAPWVPFDYWLAGYIGGQIAYMFSPTAYNKGEQGFNLHPIGTGPFMLQQWEPNNHFQCVRNPHYWRKDKWGNQLPYLDGWTYKPQPDVDSRYSYLQGGTIQMMHTDDDPTIQEIVKNTALTALGDNELPVGEPDVTFAMVDCGDPTLKDITLRQALAYCTNQKEIDNVIGKNITTPCNGPFPAPSPYASDTGYPGFDLAKATHLVNQWKAKNGGKAPSISYTTTATAKSLANASVLQQIWQQAGFQITIKQVQQAALINDALAGGYQLFGWRQFGSIHPDLNYIFWGTTSGPINFSRNLDPIIQHNLDKARQSSDPATQKQCYETIAGRLAVDLPYIYTGRDVWYVTGTKKVQNWNNPTSPAGQRGLSMISGIIWPTEVWLD